jgi:hypothetical protein
VDLVHNSTIEFLLCSRSAISRSHVKPFRLSLSAEFGGNGREIDIRLGLMRHGPLEPDRASRVSSPRFDRFAGERVAKLKRLENNAALRGQFVMWRENALCRT